MLEYSGYLHFRIDSHLPSDLRKRLDTFLVEFKDSLITELKEFDILNPQKLTVDFVSESIVHFSKQPSQLKICLKERNQGLFSFSQDLDQSDVDGILDDNMTFSQIEHFILPSLKNILKDKKKQVLELGLKNLRKFESRARSYTQKMFESESAPTSSSLLEDTQYLVGLEKELIHSDDLSKVEKVLKQFVKAHIERHKFQFFSSANLWKIVPSKHLLVLPKYKGEFVAIELNLDEDDYFTFLRKFFFVHTVVGFFSSQQEIQDPFFDEELWEGALDAIPFPVALLSEKAEIYQHNSLFPKLSFSPQDCLKLNLKDKVTVGNIPYNIFRKEFYHLDEKKILYVFFTESFFVKGDGNITPSGQELGIISSSIAHELNNPVAGIHAALTLLLLDENEEEPRQTLNEMKNGATRCKQLIETFLGFSRVNPRSSLPFESKMSLIEVCYQQAQNLLRFRTVESGIRFSFNYSKHTDFRSNVNPSLLTMTFYLILGELMTLYSHQLLVANKNQIEKVIRGEIIESSQEIQIQLTELNVSNLSLSKLIQNLITIENFVLQVSDYSLRFISNPIRDA